MDRLRDVPALDLVPKRPAVKVASSAHYDHRLGAQLTGALESLARKQRATLFMVLFAGYSSMLKNLSGQSDFCVGVPVDGRADPERENAVGLFANMLALRCDLSGDPGFAETLHRTRSLTIEALSRQDVPFGQIVAKLDLDRDPSRTQVFQTIFSVHTEAARAFALPGVSIEPFGAGSPSILHDLVLDVWRGAAGLDLTFRYDTALFSADSVVELARHYEAALEASI